MKDFRDLILAHKGKRICVMGGSGTLADELPQVKADVFISTNAHGVDLQPADYLLAMDEIHSRERVPMGTYLRARSDAPIISPHGYCDVRLKNWPQCPRFVLSGMVATWAAWAMGAKVVILAGFDAYGGEAGYVKEARKIALDVHCPVRVVGGALQDVWPAYDPAERFGKYTPHGAIDALLGVAGEVRVRALKPCTIARIDVAKGEEIFAMRHEVAKLLRHRMVEEL